MIFFRRLRVALLCIAAAVFAYGFAAQNVQGRFVTVDRAQHLGWGRMWLLMSFLFVILPAILLAAMTFRCRFDGEHPWLGEKGGLLLGIATSVAFLAGAVCGWPR
ncbi:MAG: hypothetical protein QM775_12380 [Pirellulales bacterium]